MLNPQKFTVSETSYSSLHTFLKFRLCKMLNAKRKPTTIPLTYYVVQLRYYSDAISVKYFISLCIFEEKC